LQKTVSVDATLSAAGVVTISEVDFLDTPFVDEIEGVIYRTSTVDVYNMIVSDKVNATNNSLLTSVSAGTKIAVTLDTTASLEFDVDTRNLLASTPSGFTSGSDIFSGQEVMIHVKSAATGTLLNVVTDRVVLRYSRLTGTVGTVNGQSFTIQNLPAFLGTFAPDPNVQTITGVTVFDNVANLQTLASGDTVSIRALYLHNNLSQPLQAAKVRKH
jgi:hypothetical protein